jgi:TPR repeat protein
MNIELCESAHKGNPIAQLNLGYCYANGDGVDRDLIRAKFW